MQPLPKNTEESGSASPMTIDIVTLFPELFDALNHGIVGRARHHQLTEIQCWNPRDYADNPHGYVDDKPYGGGPGMVMQAPPVAQAIEAAKQTALPPIRPWVIYLSPQGPRLNQDKVITLSKMPHLILLCGRYEGIDQRLIDSQVDEQCSIGDYVLSGGEYAALVMIDAITRWLPGALGDPESREQESFYPHPHLLDHPHYTRPHVWNGLCVPEVLRSGNHAAITAWRQQQARVNTERYRPDLMQTTPPPCNTPSPTIKEADHPTHTDTEPK